MSPEFSVGAVIGGNGSSLYRKSPPGANKEKQATFDLPVKIYPYGLFMLFFFSPPTFPFHTGCCDTSVCSLLHSDIWIQIDVVYPAVLERGAISLGLVCVYLTPCAFRSLCRFSQWWAHHTHNYTFGRIRLILGEKLWGCSSQNQWHVLSAGTNEAFQCPMPTNEVLEMFSIAGGGRNLIHVFDFHKVGTN